MKTARQKKRDRDTREVCKKCVRQILRTGNVRWQLLGSGQQHAYQQDDNVSYCQAVYYRHDGRRYDKS